MMGARARRRERRAFERWLALRQQFYMLCLCAFVCLGLAVSHMKQGGVAYWFWLTTCLACLIRNKVVIRRMKAIAKALAQ